MRKYKWTDSLYIKKEIRILFYGYGYVQFMTLI